MSNLDTFMAAIRRLESGSFEGDYSAIGPQTGKYGRARGAYQVMSAIWPGWAAEAGIPGADWRDPRAQDRVARYKMSQYYRKYGNWDLVAAAWFGGPGAANEMQRRGTSSRKDMLGTSVPGYISKIREYMGQAPGASSGGGTLRATSSHPLYTTDNERLRTLAEMLSGVGRAQSQSFTGNEFIDSMASPDVAEAQLAADPAQAWQEQQPDFGSFEEPDFVGASLDAFSEMYNNAGAGHVLQEEEMDPDELDLEGFGGFAGEGANSLEQMMIQLMERLGGEATDPIPLEGDLPVEQPLGSLATAITDSTGSFASQVIGEATKYLGTPYKWGGTNPRSGFDCSGFVQYTFKQLGINLPRTSAEQSKVGQKVGSLKQAQPGDLLFWKGSGGRPNHIGIYVGNGVMLEAPRAGLDVRYRKVNRTPHVIRRVNGANSQPVIQPGPTPISEPARKGAGRGGRVARRLRGGSGTQYR